MTIMVCYPSRAALKASIGCRLRYRETSIAGPEYLPDGQFPVVYRPQLWPASPTRGREFYAVVTMADGRIIRVE